MDIQSPVRPSLVVVGSRRVVSEDNEARRSSSGSGKSGNQRSARSLLLSPLQKSKSRLSSLIHSPSLRKKGKSLLMVGRGKSSPKQPRQHDPNNVLHWLEDACPLEIVSQVLACSGPQMAATLSRTNKFWHQVLQEESTWRTMCEALYKWKEGQPIPKSWKGLYHYSPCVPLDYPTITAALTVATHHDPVKAVRDQRHCVRVLLRPGKHYVKEAINIQSYGRTIVSIETMELPTNTLTSPVTGLPSNDVDKVALDDDDNASVARKALMRAATLRNRLSCRSVRNMDDVGMEDLALEDPEDETAASSLPPPPLRASIILKTRRHNEPLVRVRHGTIRLTNVALLHNSVGIDIWNGNSAIQIQPLREPDDGPIPPQLRPSAFLDRVDVTSKSGRGIVNIDGGHTSIKNCYVHDCAATGIYVGGPGSEALIVQTDVVRNGGGNRSRRGIARGHSGIYLEQGTAQVRDCNISRNSLTGISAVSASNAILSLEASDLVANGSVQLEMPPNGSVARRRSLTRNNMVAMRGVARTRSGLVEDQQGGEQQEEA